MADKDRGADARADTAFDRGGAPRRVERAIR